jgi:hypothetical protein
MAIYSNIIGDPPSLVQNNHMCISIVPTLWVFIILWLLLKISMGLGLAKPSSLYSYSIHIAYFIASIRVQYSNSVNDKVTYVFFLYTMIGVLKVKTNAHVDFCLFASPPQLMALKLVSSNSMECVYNRPKFKVPLM